MGFLVIRTQGSVSGIEFAPTHFQKRSFAFYEIPLVHWQITPIRRTTNTLTAATYLKQKSLISSSTKVPNKWDLVELSRGLTGSSPGDASLLVDQLELQSNGDNFWRSWSKKHPKRAKILWPVVQQLAVRELYVLLPPMMELATIAPDDVDLAEKIDLYLKNEFAGLIQDTIDAGRPQLAEELEVDFQTDFPHLVK